MIVTGETQSSSHKGSLSSKHDLLLFLGARLDWCQALNCTIHVREIQLFCYITNSQIVENENGSVT